MSFNHFDYVPSSVNTGRSVFKFEKAIMHGAEIGYLYPMCAPVRMLPGSSLKLNLAMELRSGALIAPLADELFCDVFAFSVPNRIVWEHWKQFLGAVDDVLFDNLEEYQIPSFDYCAFDYDEGVSRPYLASHLLASCFELPIYELNTASTAKYPKINALPFRGYTFIWNEFFRPEQLVDPILFSKTDAGNSGQNTDYTFISINFNGSVLDVVAPTYNQTGPISGGVVLPTFRVHKSLWTSCLPKPSLESPSLLSAVGSAPVGIFDGQSNELKQAFIAGSNGAVQVGGGYGTNKPVIADLSQVNWTANQLRETLLLQSYYDVLNRAGSRYDEIMRNLFHTTASDAIIDIPELIVHKRFTIYRKEVVATAETSNDGNTTALGSQAGYIDTVIKDSFFTTSTTEHGFVHMLYTIRPARIRMANGVEPMWEQLDKFSQYYPQFDGMGDVARMAREVFLGSATVSNTILGYQEYGAEYKYQRNSATGWMNPYLSGHVPGFTITEKLGAEPSLIPSEIAGVGSYISCILEEESFASCLAISNPMVAPQFIVDIRLTGEIVHPMPVYNIPGMGDVL